MCCKKIKILETVWYEWNYDTINFQALKSLNVLSVLFRKKANKGDRCNQKVHLIFLRILSKGKGIFMIY